MYFDHGKDSVGAEGANRRSASPPAPATTPLSSVEALQTAAGNAAVTQAIQRSMGVPQDTVGNAELSRAIQRSLHEHGPACGHDQPVVQRRTTLFDAQRTPGRPLSPHIQKKAEQAYGMPFSHVRVHDDPVSQQSAEQMGASAYTSGPDIFIGTKAVDDETMYHELDHVRQQALGPVAGTDDGTGTKVSNPRDAFEVSSAANGRRVARGEAPDLTLPGSHGHGGAVQRAAAEPVVQRMEDPRGRRDSRDYEADESGPERGNGQDSDSSPERRELREQIRRQIEGGADLDELAERANRFAGEAVPFRRVRRVLPESDSDSPSPERAAQPPARERLALVREPMPTLPESTALAPLRELLMHDLRDENLNKKLKVTFNVSSDRTLAGGHAWMEVTGSEGKRVTFGFFPVDRTIAALGNMPGGVRCPDPVAVKHSPTDHESKNVPLRDVIKGYQLVHDRAQENYNFTLHNCTTFASDVWKTMTGKAIPADFFTAVGLLSLAISTPKAAAEGLEGHQEQRTNNRRERVLPLAQGPVRGVIPGSGTAEEVADRLARARQSQTSSSESTEEVD
ncbi:DUF4157 domain-containing protein [Streptomyces sp. NPDC094468]|uniref:eCIS core domain-containing protein n=2 Tax=unclassified Streptomyces TaxID=2593676 RepID=UPI0037F5278A